MFYAPIHGCIEDLYWRLWVEANDVETSRSAVGSRGEAFKTGRTDRGEAPMESAIVVGWQAIMKAILPTAVDGDLLKLVHLSIGFRRRRGGAGEIVEFAKRDDVPVLEVLSSFLCRGRYSDLLCSQALTPAAPRRRTSAHGKLLPPYAFFEGAERAVEWSPTSRTLHALAGRWLLSTLS
ncbi:uncharacterized protein B0H18DRAFT_1113832 [Fomitopsis serialis]|uniref:uncharacterized protein n=1 Tax=Fomitopsis serialis TaxID=139415 RepID=UPI0020082C50|nr:uncharacterized protein B0H18DRAFT_1113832 [Neoantrodia serialis]KAH9936447.1 hypothetical protein B0H18DRAFT_1113832 [Neoantrodia serialis]